MPIENEELIEKAQELEINVDDHDDEDSLQDAIDEAESKKAESEKKKKDPEYLESEAKKAYKARDRAKQEARTLRTKIKELEESQKGKVDQAKLDELQEQLDDLLEKEQEREEEEEKKKLEKADEVEKVKIRSEKEMTKMQKDFDTKLKEFEERFNKTTERLQGKEKEVESLRRIRLGNEIRDVAGDMKAYNPKQIVKLLADDFEYDEELDKFFYPVKEIKRGELTLVDEKTVEERVKEFLEDPDNDNLVEAEINKGGTGHKKTESGKVPEKKTKTGEYDPKDSYIIKEAEKRDMTPENLIKTWIKRDEKMNKIKENREERRKEERQLRRR